MLLHTSGTNICCVNQGFNCTTELGEDIDKVLLDAKSARNTTRSSIDRVLSIEQQDIGRIINKTSTNTEDASKALDTSQTNCMFIILKKLLLV